MKRPGNCARSMAATAVHLFVSGRGRPNGASADPHPERLRSDDDLLAILDRFGGTPAAIMQRPELIAALLPALRADLALVEGYAADPDDRIGSPITALGGADDVSHSGSLEVLERIGQRKIPDLIFSRRAFLLLARGGGARQGDHPGLARICGHAACGAWS